MKTKKTFMLILLSVVLAVFVSCGVQTPPAEPNEDVAAQESQPIAPESDVTVEQPRNTIEISSLYMEPKLEELLNESDIIIEGEVIEEKESYHTNPDRTLTRDNGEIVTPATVSPYVIRVDRVYKGDIQAGQTVLVNTLNNTWLTPDQLENYNIVSDEPSCYLTVGQKALFCAAFFSCYSPAGSTVDQTGYYIVYDTEGIFEPEAKNSEQIAALDAAEQPDRLLFSESLTIDLDTLEDEIQKAGTDSEK